MLEHLLRISRLLSLVLQLVWVETFKCVPLPVLEEDTLLSLCEDDLHEQLVAHPHDEYDAFYVSDILFQ